MALYMKQASAADDPISRALSLFASDEIAAMPRVVLAATRPEHVAADAEGYTVPGYPVIYIAEWSETYRRAMIGDRDAMIKLAGIIAHERAHVAEGPDERTAYMSEILMLRRCGASAAMIEGVRRSMRAVVR
jgi:hypothetical protein